MSRHTRWIDDGNSWCCEKHLPSVVMPASSGLCAFSTCDSVRPKRESFTTIGKTLVKPTPAPKPATKTKPSQPTNVRKKKPTTPVKAKTSTVSTPENNTENVELCAWFKCTRGEGGVHAPARAKSKYCSRACSNANARFQHKQRKKDEE